MKLKTDPNDQAYPVATTDHDAGHFGLTKREYFAALALQGLLASPLEPGELDGLSPDDILNHFSASAVSYADALIEALNE